MGFDCTSSWSLRTCYFYALMIQLLMYIYTFGGQHVSSFCVNVLTLCYFIT